MTTLNEQEKLDFYNKFKSQIKENFKETEVEEETEPLEIKPESLQFESQFSERLSVYPFLIEVFK